MHLKKKEEKSAESNAIVMLQVGHDSKVCTQINKCEGLICTCSVVGDGKTRMSCVYFKCSTLNFISVFSQFKNIYIATIYIS